MFDPTKPVRTRDGRQARILATDLDSHRPIVAAVRSFGGGETLHEYLSNGRNYDYNDKPLDIVNIPEKHTIEIYVYRGIHGPAVTADKNFLPMDASYVRARKTIEYTDGEGL